MMAQPVGTARHAGQVSYEQPPRGRLARLFQAADRRRVPLRTILVTAGVVVAAYLAGQLMYLLRDVVLLMLVGGFTAVLLNPAVAKWVTPEVRRGRQAASGSSAGFWAACSRALIRSRSRARSAAVNFQLNGRAAWL